MFFAFFAFLGHQRRPYIVFRNCFCMASCLYIYIYIYIYIYYVCIIICICQDGGAVGFVDFTKLSLAQPFDQMGNISEFVFV